MNLRIQPGHCDSLIAAGQPVKANVIPITAEEITDIREALFSEVPNPKNTNCVIFDWLSN